MDEKKVRSVICIPGEQRILTVFCRPGWLLNFQGNQFDRKNRVS
jgi:hypothetical protein